MKVFLLVSILVGVVGGLVVSSIFIKPYATTRQEVLGNEEWATPSPTAELVSVPDEPRHFVIPSLGIQAEVEMVDLDEKGNMDVPQSDWNVGWYEHGVKPGEQGSAVIAGHLDSPTGPAIFYTLPRIEIGEEIVVTDSKGKEWEFVVERVETYRDDSFPIDEVFTKSDTKRLNLITCVGTFDRTVKNYSHRLVVFAVLKES